MEIVMIFVCGILTAMSVYLILSKSLIRIIIGTTLQTHTANLFLITMGGLKKVKSLFMKRVHFICGSNSTSTHINSNCNFIFSNSLFLVLAFRSYKELGTDNVESMKGVLDNDRE